MTTTDHEYRERFIAGLRELADFLLAHPEVPLPIGELREARSATTTGTAWPTSPRSTAALGVEVSYLADDPQYPQAIRKFGPAGTCGAPPCPRRWTPDVLQRRA
jgi:hypothetical protein